MWQWPGHGAILVKNQFEKKVESLPDLPRLGMNVQLNDNLERIGWYGRGAGESYWDRKTGMKIGLYEGNVADQYWPYIRPQENGNKSDVRWGSLTDKVGVGIRVIGFPTVDISTQHNLLEDFQSLERSDGRHRDGDIVKNRHTADVKRKDLTNLNIDFKQMGVGGDNSWGGNTHNKYKLTKKVYEYSFSIRPLK